MSIFESLSGVFSCMLMIFIGYYLTQRKWFDQPTAKLFSKMAMSLTIPLYMIVSMHPERRFLDAPEDKTKASVKEESCVRV